MTRLRFERLNRGMNQTRLAAAAGITQATLSLIETGRLKPTEYQLHALARTLDVSADTLLAEVRL